MRQLLFPIPGTSASGIPIINTICERPSHSNIDNGVVLVEYRISLLRFQHCVGSRFHQRLKYSIGPDLHGIALTMCFDEHSN